MKNPGKSGLEPTAPSRSEDIALYQLSQILNYKTDASLVKFRRMPFQLTQKTTEDVDNGHSKECRALDVDLQRQHFQLSKIRQGSSQEFVKEYTEGNCGGPGAVPPGKFLIFEVTRPYFLYFLMQKRCGRSINNPQLIFTSKPSYFSSWQKERERREI